jgi:hypothetical protein
MEWASSSWAAWTPVTLDFRKEKPMKRTLSSALILGLFLFPAVGLVGCGEQAKTARTETITTPGGTTTTTLERKVKSTGENPPANYAGETGKTSK